MIYDFVQKKFKCFFVNFVEDNFTFYSSFKTSMTFKMQFQLLKCIIYMILAIFFPF